MWNFKVLKITTQSISHNGHFNGHPYKRGLTLYVHIMVKHCILDPYLHHITKHDHIFSIGVFGILVVDHIWKEEDVADLEAFVKGEVFIKTL